MTIPADRSYRGPGNSAFLEVTDANKGLGVLKKSGQYVLPTKDKSGAHAISTWSTLQCKSMGESIYSDNVKRSVNGSTSTNPNIIKSNIIRDPHEPKAEKFTYYDNHVKETYSGCGCGKVFQENSDKLLTSTPVVIAVLVIIAAGLFIWCIVNKFGTKVGEKKTTGGGSMMSGGFINEDAVDII